MGHHHLASSLVRLAAILTILPTAVVVVHADFITDCPAICSCIWSSGNKATSCNGKDLKEIPKNISNETQNLNLSSNPLFEIQKDAFANAGFRDLKKLYLKNCSISFIHKDGFRSLRIMIELDLSKNEIISLDPDTFSDLSKLRIINLNNNYIKKVPEGMFKNLEHLQTINLNNNHIIKVAPRAFINVHKLKILDLSQNNLTYIKLDFTEMTNLNSLELHSNPWKCDCSLQLFRNYIIDNKLYTPPTSCNEPPHLLKRLWSELNSTDFACRPNILDSIPTSIVTAIGENVTLPCKATGNPSPEINWMFNGRNIHGDPRKHTDHRYVVFQGGPEMTRWVNLTIVNVKFTDRGEFTCVAKNPGGNDERAVALTVNRVAAAAGGGVGTSDYLIYILIAVGVVVFVVLLFLATCCLCKRSNVKRHSKSDMHSSNGEALIEGSVIPEIEKSLITTVNPVTKPPRKYEVPSSVMSGGTEMSELNKTLLDNDSVFAPNEDDARSADFIEQKPKSSRDSLSVAAPNPSEHKAYPPDLLSFPPRGGQASPAASSASTAPDSTRLPPQMHQSPLHSPIYGTNPSLYKTLTHSRSQSPFTSPCTPAAPARIGYVTIPRRPRVPSWGSTASYMTVTVPAEYVEPVYDNLGLRTTADGSSVLSLNKTGLDQPLSPPGGGSMRGRPLPSTPGAVFQPPVMYTPIEEQERAPSPAPSTPYGSTLPRIGSNSLQFQLSDLDRKIARPKPKTPMMMMNGDGGYDATRPLSPLTNGQIYDTPSANDALPSRGSVGKVPPRPPPKPKKKNSTNGPLFEDEGEDGTEV